MQQLHTIRGMIDIEFERRELNTEGNPHPENPPPENASREPPDCKPSLPHLLAKAHDPFHRMLIII